MMTTEPLALLEALLSHSGNDIIAHQFTSADRLSPMVKAGWLVPSSRADATLCVVCDDTHMAEVICVNEETLGVCRRTGETFLLSRACSLYRVDGDAFARSLAAAFQLDGNTRPLRGFKTVWKLGTRRLEDMAIVFFLVPRFDGIDAANTILEAVAQQARARTSALIVADDIDAVEVLPRHIIVRLRDVVAMDEDGNMSADADNLFFQIFPQVPKPQRPGRPAEQQRRVLALLDDLAEEGVIIDTSNSTWRRVRDKFIQRYPKASAPAKGTIRTAVGVWQEKRQ
jgi:hypothetical protein